MPITKKDVTTFLRTEKHLEGINFRLGDLKVYTLGYRDVADAIDREEILVHVKEMDAGIAAQYFADLNVLELSETADIADPQQQALVVHECTHALLDLQVLGSISNYENEGAAYLAEALFLESAKAKPIGDQSMRVWAHTIARWMRENRQFELPKGASRLLAEAVASHPHYAGTSKYGSDGVNPESQGGWDLLRAFGRGYMRLPLYDHWYSLNRFR